MHYRALVEQSFISYMKLCYHCMAICCQEDIVEIFRTADTDKSGTLNLEEFQEIMDDLVERYPQLELHLKSKQMRNIDELLEKSWQNPTAEVDIETFKSALSQADSQMKNLPATAQVN